MATKTEPRPTPKMVAFMQKLARERVLPSLGADADARAAALDNWLATPEADKWECMRRIDYMKAQPVDRGRAETPAELTRGVYERNGTVWVVKKSRGSERLYASRVVEVGGERLNEDDEVVRFELEYDRGAIYRLRPADRMPLARAEHFMTRYGRCLVCGRTLKVASSVKAGVGPVCAQYFGQ